MAAPATDGVSLIIDQNEAILRASGETEEEIADARAFAETVMPAVRDGDADAAEAGVREYFGALWDRQSDADRIILGDREAFVQRQVDSQLPLYLSDWFRSILAYDPAPDWQQVGVPVLGLFGARDVQVVTEPNEEALRAALAAGGNRDVEIVVFADANHLFQASETGALQEYGTLEPAFTPEFLPTLVEWVTARGGVSG